MRSTKRGPRWPFPTTRRPALREAPVPDSLDTRWPSRKLDSLVERLADARGGRVVFVSHCLLNENVRYLGGATRSGPLESLLDRCRIEGLGICQMPCPEQHAWGGVRKRHALRLYGIGPLELAAVRALTLVVAGYTRVRYRQLARRIANDIADYQRSGLEVVEVLGVGASPSCGVSTTLPLGPTLEAIAACNPVTLTADGFNEQVIRAGVTAGRGLFIEELARQLRRRRLHVSMREHDLLRELDMARPNRGGAAQPEPARQ